MRFPSFPDPARPSRADRRLPRPRRALLAGLLLVLAVPTAARAEEPAPSPEPAPSSPRELVVSFGYRTWFEKTRDNGAVGNMGYTLLHGPILGLGYRRWGLSVTYLQGGTSFRGIEQGGDTQAASALEATVDREDVDVALSYRLLDFLRPFVGYKYVHAPTVVKSSAAAEWTSLDQAESYGGPSFGVNALFRPFKDDRFFVSGTFLYGPLKVRSEEKLHRPDGTTQTSTSDTYSVHGLSWDVSAGCALGHGLTATAGYKTQRVRRNTDVGVGPEDVNGPFFALLYSF